MYLLLLIYCVSFSLFTDVDLAGLIRRASRRRWHHLRPGSRINIFVHVRTYLGFCSHFAITDFPASQPVLAAYIEFLLLSFRAPGSVRSYISGLATFHKWMGWDDSVFHSAQLKLTWRAIDLTVRHAPVRSLEIDLADLAVLMSSCSILGSRSLLFRSLLSLLFFSMVRISTLLPPTHHAFDRTRHLNFDDIVFTGSGLTLLVKWAKNLQQRANAFKIPILSNANRDICPVYALLTYLETFHSNLSGLPLFLVNVGSSAPMVPLSIALARSWLRLVVAASPLAGRYITFHSFLRGSCNQAFRSGASLSDIQFFGGWKSASVLDYLQLAPARLRVAHHLSQHI